MSLVTMPTPPSTDNPQPATRNSDSKDRRLPLLLLSALIILLDRLSKTWVMHHVKASAPITIIPRVFRLTHVLNTGAAFSLLENLPANKVRIALIVFSVVAAIIVFAMLWRVGRTLTLTSIALALILGGALANLYDRVRLHYVVDFLEVHIYHYHWPDFNIADSAIVIGACLLLIEIFSPQPAES